MISQARNRFDWKVATSAFSILTLWAAAAAAAPINYGDIGPDPPGVTMYNQVTESSATDPIPPGRYGEPTINGNLLDFDPVQFVAFATGGDADITDVQLNFQLMTVGAGVTEMTISESGDFTLIGGGTALTQVAVGIGARIDILGVDGSPLAEPESVFLSATFDANLADDGPVQVAPWANSLVVDFEAILTELDIPFEFGVSKADIVIDNQLVAISEDSSVAFIAKKDFQIATDVEIVPEPASLGMMLVAVVGFGLAFRRRLTRSHPDH